MIDSKAAPRTVVLANTTSVLGAPLQTQSLSLMRGHSGLEGYRPHARAGGIEKQRCTHDHEVRGIGASGAVDVGGHRRTARCPIARPHLRAIHRRVRRELQSPVHVPQVGGIGACSATDVGHHHRAA
jgi:hypothetical protein